MSAIAAAIALLGETIVLGGLPIGYAWIDHHGPKNWQEFKARQEARGEILDLAELIDQTEVPPKKNFATLPMIAQLFGPAGPAVQTVESLDIPNIAGLEIKRPGRGDRNIRSAWMGSVLGQERSLSRYIPDAAALERDADYILLCLEPHQKALRSIASAAARPYCRFPIAWEEGFAAKTPHLSALQTITKTLSLDAEARIHAGDPGGSLLSLVSALRIANHAETADASLIGHLVSMALRAIALEPLWLGLKLQTWEPDDLELIDAVLAASDVGKAHMASVRFERAYMTKLFLDLAEGRAPLELQFGTSQNLLSALMPRGLFYENATALCKLFEQSCFSSPTYPASVIRHFDDTVAMKQISQWSKTKRPDRFLACTAFPVYGRTTSKSLQAETKVRLARIAIALERHRAVKRNYPKTLAALHPRFIAALPLDPITGKDFRYEIRADDSPAIWSVGINEIDEGGRPKKNTELGDWAWQYQLPDGYGYEEYSSNDPIELP
jgi:hypothetical protein